MPQDPLLTQLAERCRTFSAGTSVSLNKIAKLVGMEPSNFSNFINGKIGLSSRATIELLRLLNLSRREVEMKLSAKTVHVEHLQQEGQLMTLDDNGGWVAGDSSGSDSIDDVPTARDLPNSDDYLDEIHDFLRGQQSVHRSAIAAIDDYFNTLKAKVNKTGSTEPARRTDDNERSRTAGPRPDRFAALETAKQARKTAEAELKAARETLAEKEAAHKAAVELARLRQSPEERKAILDRAERSFDSKYALAH